jgi:hypothetical protein
LSAISDAARTDVLDETVLAPPSLSPREHPFVLRALKAIVYFELVVSAVVLACLNVRWGYHNGALGFDFLGTLWEPAGAILDGESPYPPPLKSAVDVGNPAYYPPLLMLLVTPLTYLPWLLGAILWTGLLIAALLATLYVLGVRDKRCYALAVISAPVVNGVMWGNATLLLVLLVALAWRWRAHPWRSGILIGLGIAIKLFLWPLLFWQLGTRRYRAAATTTALAAIGVLVPWAVIGFDGFLAYPDLLRVAQEVYAVHGQSTATILGALGLETEPATRGGLAAGLAVGVLAFVVGRRGHDEASVSLGILAALAASPVVWEHYFAFLLIPIAIARPRFSALWMTLPLFQLALLLPAPRLGPGSTDPGGVACCPPDDVPFAAWIASHAPPPLWPALAHAALAASIGLAVWTITRRRLSGGASP